MSLRSEIADACREMVEEEGEAAICTPLSGDPAPCKVWLDFEAKADADPGGFAPTAWQGHTVIEVLLADFATPPVHGDAFTIDGATYAVLDVFFNDRVTAKMTVTEE